MVRGGGRGKSTDKERNPRNHSRYSRSTGILGEKYFKQKMDFPPENYDIFHAEDFEMAETRNPGQCGVEVMAQARPNGRVMDHWRLAIGGSRMLQYKGELVNIIPAANSTPKWFISYEQWPRDVVIRRNMTTSTWVDILTLIEANEILVADERDQPVANQTVVEALNAMADKNSNSAAARWAVCIGESGKLELQLQLMPAPASFLVSRPTFRRYWNKI